MITQSPFMIMATIDSQQADELRQLLASMNQAPGIADPHNELIPFYQFSQLHFARFTILEANTNDDIRDYGIEPKPWAPALVFVGDVDGPTAHFLAELVIRAEKGIRRIFSHCLNFDAEADNLLEWLRQHNVKPTANYVNWRGRSVVQIREEQTLAQAIREALPEAQIATGNEPYAMHRQLREFTDAEMARLRLRLSRKPPTPPGQFVLNLLHLIGEILLGHVNEYGLYTDRPLLSPDTVAQADILPEAEDQPGSRDFGRNGCYLVMRQLEQDVPGFWQFVDQAAAGDAAERERLAAAMVGRQRDGTPLIASHENTAPGDALSDASADNEFSFDDDPLGRACPIGAHVRRANPRTGDFPPGTDSLLIRLLRTLGFCRRQANEDLVSSTRFHRLLRRGIEFSARKRKPFLDFGIEAGHGAVLAWVGYSDAL